jgi:hypothetical protein
MYEAEYADPGHPEFAKHKEVEALVIALDAHLSNA